MRKDLKLISLSLAVILLSLVVTVLSGDKSGATTFGDSNLFVNNRATVASADLLNSGDVSRETVVENTDFARKTIRFKEGTSTDIRNQTIAEVGGEVVAQVDNSTVVVKVPEDELPQAEQTLASSESVEVFETDYAVGLLSTVDWGVSRIKANEVWSESRGGGVRVAIVDTGIDRNHSDMGGYVGGFDFVNEDSDPQDDHGHGTAVAGIAASAQNGVATVGVAPELSILGVKVLASDGVGYVSDVVEGIDWAVANGASVINLSLGTTYDSSFLKSAVDSAAASGVVLVAAAGNTNGGSLVYPAAYDSVIAVGATYRNDALASFSSVGSEIVAPGVSITAPWLGGGTTTISGTSASSPHVAGVVAHLLANGVTDVRSALRDTSEDLGQEGVDPLFGHGLVSTVSALGFDEEDSELPLVEFISPRNGQKLASRGQVVVNIRAEDNKAVLKVDLVVNGEFVYSSATAPYQWRWNLANTASGAYELVAKAFDETGNVSEVGIAVEVIAGQGAEVPTPIPGSVPEEVQEKIPTEKLPEPAIEKIPTSSNQNKGQGQGQGQGQSNKPQTNPGRGNVQGVSTSWSLINELIKIFFGR